MELRSRKLFLIKTFISESTDVTIIKANTSQKEKTKFSI